MNIMFMTKFPDGSDTMFKEKILNGLPKENGSIIYLDLEPKLHTIRQSKRVKVGMKLKLCN